jgi:hypothetical protein
VPYAQSEGRVMECIRNATMNTKTHFALDV